MDNNLWMILYEGFHGLIACQSEIVVELCRTAVAVLSPLPEESLVVAEEWGALHL